MTVTITCTYITFLLFITFSCVTSIRTLRIHRQQSSATIPFQTTCDVNQGFLMNPIIFPSTKTTIGYITSLNGFGLPATLTPDLLVADPIKKIRVPVVGVLQSFSWAGGVGDAITVHFYVSQSNAQQIKSLQQLTLNTIKITAFNYQIYSTDATVGRWYTWGQPQTGGLTGSLGGSVSSPTLSVDLNPTAVGTTSNYVNLVQLSIVPSANLAYQLKFATSASLGVVKSWGLVVGTIASSGIASV